MAVRAAGVPVDGGRLIAVAGERGWHIACEFSELFRGSEGLAGSATVRAPPGRPDGGRAGRVAGRVARSHRAACDDGGVPGCGQRERPAQPLPSAAGPPPGQRPSVVVLAPVAKRGKIPLRPRCSHRKPSGGVRSVAANSPPRQLRSRARYSVAGVTRGRVY